MTKWIQISLFGLIMISAYNTIFPDTTVNDDSNGEITWQFIIALFLLNFFSAFQVCLMFDVFFLFNFPI